MTVIVRYKYFPNFKFIVIAVSFINSSSPPCQCATHFDRGSTTPLKGVLSS